MMDGEVTKIHIKYRERHWLSIACEHWELFGSRILILLILVILFIPILLIILTNLLIILTNLLILFVLILLMIALEQLRVR